MSNGSVSQIVVAEKHDPTVREWEAYESHRLLGEVCKALEPLIAFQLKMRNAGMSYRMTALQDVADVFNQIRAERPALAEEVALAEAFHRVALADVKAARNG